MAGGIHVPVGVITGIAEQVRHSLKGVQQLKVGVAINKVEGLRRESQMTPECIARQFVDVRVLSLQEKVVPV
jgi:hypothetical protein